MKKGLILPLVTLLALPTLAVTMGGYSGGLLTQFVALGLATAALAMCWGFAGILTLGHAVSFALGAYAYAWVSINLGTEFQVLGMLFGILLAGALSALIGFIGLRGQVDGIAFGLFTLVVLYAAAQVAIAIPDVTGGFNGLSGIRRFAPFGIEIADEAGRALLVIIALLGVFLIQLLMRGPLGAALQLLRDSPIRAASFGYRVPAMRIWVFTGAGALAGLAGALYAAEVRFVSPSVVAVSMAVSFVVWALIGSRTSVFGAFFAAIALGFVTNELSDKLLNVWMLITGLLFIGFVLFAPQGIVELVRERLPLRMRGLPKVKLDTAQSATVESAKAFEVSDVSVKFGGFQAIGNVSLSAQPGIIHVLIGPNGAGKSTLLNAVSGILPNTTGKWSLGETSLTGKKPWQIARDGVGRKYQKPSLALDLTVAQHLALGAWGPTRSEWSLLFAPWHVEISAEGWEFCKRSGLSEILDTPARELSHGQRQSLELAMVLASSPHALLLDEPAAGMTRAESAELGGLLLDITKETNVPVLMVEHDMDLVRRISGRVTVLAAGRTIGEGTVEMIENDPEVRAIYLGDATLAAIENEEERS